MSRTSAGVATTPFKRIIRLMICCQTSGVVRMKDMRPIIPFSSVLWQPPHFSMVSLWSTGIPSTAAFVWVDAARRMATPNVVLTSLNGGTIWVVTFVSNSNATVTGHSIADGIYTATLNSSLVTAVSNGAEMTTTRPTDTFYRLFGDFAGNGRVNSTDSGTLNLSFGLNYQSVSGYLDYFDFAGSGRVNAMTAGELNLNFGSFWRGFAATI